MMQLQTKTVRLQHRRTNCGVVAADSLVAIESVRVSAILTESWSMCRLWSSQSRMRKDFAASDRTILKYMVVGLICLL